MCWIRSVAEKVPFLTDIYFTRKIVLGRCVIEIKCAVENVEFYPSRVCFFACHRNYIIILSVFYSSFKFFFFYSTWDQIRLLAKLVENGNPRWGGGGGYLLLWVIGEGQGGKHIVTASVKDFSWCVARVACVGEGKGNFSQGRRLPANNSNQSMPKISYVCRL